jgi:fumarate hydratase, class II
MSFRFEKDTIGEIKVPADKLWGAQTQRSLNNFQIGPTASMPFEIIEAFGVIKKAAAITNYNFGLLSEEKKDLIIKVCDEIIAGKLQENFPLVIWQTGSGTHTNMNCNEVISNRAQILKGEKINSKSKLLHPIDDVNKSQSSNDTFSSAMHIAAYSKIKNDLLPQVLLLRKTFLQKQQEFWDIVKVGRTHCMDATPIRLGQVFSGYVAQVDQILEMLENTYAKLSELPLGGTATGTGLNTVKRYDEKVIACIASITNLPFKLCENKFAMLANHDTIAQSHSILKNLAINLIKIGNDIRMMASGPEAGLNELGLPKNEVGSSIMPEKVNPTQIEALTMVCAQVIGNDTTISIANSNGQFELNVYKPVIIANMLQSVSLLADSCKSFVNNCLKGIIANKDQITSNLENSLMLITALTPKIGYENASKIAQKAKRDGLTLKEATHKLGLISSEQELNSLFDTTRMTEPRDIID